jgi:hypothetical protein
MARARCAGGQHYLMDPGVKQWRLADEEKAVRRPGCRLSEREMEVEWARLVWRVQKCEKGGCSEDAHWR